MRRILLGLTAIAFLATCGLSAEPKPEPATEAAHAELNKILAGYKTWQPMTAKPVFVRGDPPCGPGNQPSVIGPHGWRYNNVYVSPEAKEAYRTRKRFAAGTVIVKEKLQEETSKSHEGLGIMIKQTAGTSAATGDWKYAYIDIDGRVLLGKSVEHCARCHLRAPNDSVFGPR
jgi:hypothetical protein